MERSGGEGIDPDLNNFAFLKEGELSTLISKVGYRNKDKGSQLGLVRVQVSSLPVPVSLGIRTLVVFCPRLKQSSTREDHLVLPYHTSKGEAVYKHRVQFSIASPQLASATIMFS